MYHTFPEDPHKIDWVSETHVQIDQDRYDSKMQEKTK